jgi:RNA polymerase sigma-70 factor (ECF subfamily)
MRTLLALRYEEDLPISELTKKMNVQHSTMTMRLHRIREQLRQCMAKPAESFE